MRLNCFHRLVHMESIFTIFISPPVGRTVPLCESLIPNFTDLWCTSPKHRYFCTKDIYGPDLTLFLIPFTEVIHLIERKKLLDGLAKYSKLREL